MRHLVWGLKHGIYLIFVFNSVCVRFKRQCGSFKRIKLVFEQHQSKRLFNLSGLVKVSVGLNLVEIKRNKFCFCFLAVELAWYLYFQDFQFMNCGLRWPAALISINCSSPLKDRSSNELKLETQSLSICWIKRVWFITQAVIFLVTGEEVATGMEHPQFSLMYVLVEGVAGYREWCQHHNGFSMWTSSSTHPFLVIKS